MPNLTNADHKDTTPSIAVIIPCFNEEAAIAKVVQDFKEHLPGASIYVYDNNSTDRTSAVAKEAGAIVRDEPRKGKGFVVRRMFADIEADIYLMIDGDDTYNVSFAPQMVELLVKSGLDMVNGARMEEEESAYRPGHKFGNWMLSGLVRKLFGDEFKDMLSGYRVFSRRFVKSFPIMSGGFEIETELTIHALELAMPTSEVPVGFKDRDEGSESKLNTFSDGFRILFTITSLLKQERPAQLFGAIFGVLFIVALLLGIPIVTEFVDTGLVPRFPTAILATGTMILGFLSLVCGIVLDTVTRGRREIKRLKYLQYPGIQASLER